MTLEKQEAYLDAQLNYEDMTWNPLVLRRYDLEPAGAFAFLPLDFRFFDFSFFLLAAVACL